MGQKPIPTKLKRLRGNPGQRRLNDNEPQPPTAKRPPYAPKWLSETAKEEWRRVAPYLWSTGILTEVDEAALAVYCESYATFQVASQLLAKEGPTIENGKGQTIRNPAQAAASSAAMMIRSFCVEFGLTPSSRTRMRLPDESDDELSHILEGSNSES